MLLTSDCEDDSHMRVLLKAEPLAFRSNTNECFIKLICRRARIARDQRLHSAGARRSGCVYRSLGNFEPSADLAQGRGGHNITRFGDGLCRIDPRLGGFSSAKTLSIAARCSEDALSPRAHSGGQERVRIRLASDTSALASDRAWNTSELKFPLPELYSADRQVNSWGPIAMRAVTRKVATLKSSIVMEETKNLSALPVILSTRD